MATNFGHNWVITLNVTENPKIKFGANGAELKSYKRFALYRNGMSVADYKAAVLAHPCGGKGYAAADLVWDTQRGFITITAPGAKPAPAPLPAIPDTPINAALQAAAQGADAATILAQVSAELGMPLAPNAKVTKGRKLHAA